MSERMTVEPATAGRLTAEETARYVATEAVWAPSVHNTQPWRLVADGQQISLYADADRELPVADPDGREMMISCDAALFNARLTLRSLGYIPETRVLPDPGQPTLVAQVSWRQHAPVCEFERRLSSQVHLRRTHRGTFTPEPLRRQAPGQNGTGEAGQAGRGDQAGLPGKLRAADAAAEH